MKRLFKEKSEDQKIIEMAKKITGGDKNSIGIIMGYHDGHFVHMIKGSDKTLTALIALGAILDTSGHIKEVLDNEQKMRKGGEAEFPNSKETTEQFKDALIRIIKENV